MKSLKKQLGIFGFITDLLGGSDKKTEKTSGTRDLDEIATRTGTKTGEEEFETQQVDETRILSEGVETAVTDLLLSVNEGLLEGDTNADQLAEIAALLFQRGEGAEEAVNKRTGAIVSAERFRGEENINAIESSLARQAGGTKANSFVAGATGKAEAQLSLDLAALESGLSIQARQIETDELTNAANITATAGAAGATQTNEIVALANVLKGATEKGTSAKTGIASSKEEFDELLDRLLSETTTGDVTTEDDRDLFDVIELFTG